VSPSVGVEYEVVSRRRVIIGRPLPSGILTGSPLRYLSPSVGVEYEVERAVNPLFASYADAVYFSVTTLTTVGFGDIAPITPTGRAFVALEMVAAVTVIPTELAAVAKVITGRGDATRSQVL